MFKLPVVSVEIVTTIKNKKQGTGKQIYLELWAVTCCVNVKAV